jgi:putative aminopeptidase FrvX
MKLLKALYRISSPSGMEDGMIRFIVRRLEALGVDYSVDRVGNIFATKGHADTYPCLVAHTDEVHHRGRQRFEVVDLRGELLFGYDRRARAFAGIGADDKNGIWVCLKSLEEFDVLKCAFFVDEERGSLGSGAADMRFFDDCRFVVQCDRKGSGDLVTSINGLELCSDEFVRAVQPARYGYAPTHGLHTDVFTLKSRGLAVSCVNLSCGYYLPHTDCEHTIIRDLHKCLRFVRHIIEGCTEVYAHTSAPQRTFGSYRCGFFEQFDYLRAGSMRGTRAFEGDI